jgi:hypothetical protein
MTRPSDKNSFFSLSLPVDMALSSPLEVSYQFPYHIFELSIQRVALPSRLGAALS